MNIKQFCWTLQSDIELMIFLKQNSILSDIKKYYYVIITSLNYQIQNTNVH